MQVTGMRRFLSAAWSITFFIMVFSACLTITCFPMILLMDVPSVLTWRTSWPGFLCWLGIAIALNFIGTGLSVWLYGVLSRRLSRCLLTWEAFGQMMRMHR